MNSVITIRLERDATDRPWGFRLQGGNDFPIPLSIQLVNPDTPAYVNGLNAGDHVISINGRNVTNISHQEAKMEITRSGNELELTVIKGVVNQQPSQASSQQRTDLVRQVSIPQGGNEVTYQTGKATYWPPNDPTQETPENLRPKISTFQSSPAYNRDPLQREIWRPKAYRDDPQAPVRDVGTAVYHDQYNSPIGLYSDDKVLEAFKSQTASLIDEIKGNDSTEGFRNQPLPTYQSVTNSQQNKNTACSSEGKLSRSFRALEQDLSSIQGTSKAPRSIFDQRREQR